jgi:hypothetical protein
MPRMLLIDCYSATDANWLLETSSFIIAEMSGLVSAEEVAGHLKMTLAQYDEVKMNLAKGGQALLYSGPAYPDAPKQPQG